VKLASNPASSPEPFPLAELGELVEFRRGLTYKKSDEVEFSSTGVLRANNVNLASGQLDFSNIRYLSDDLEVPLTRKLVSGSLLICTASGSRAHLGKMAYVATAPDFAFGGFMGLLVPKAGVLARYLWYFSRSNAYRNYLDSLAPGANINNLRFDDLAGLEVPLPPLDEQKRIVAVLDQAFAVLDRAHANAEANLEDARGLFLSSLRDVFLNRSAAWTSGDSPRVRNDSEVTSGGKAKRSKNHTQTGGREATARPIHGDYSLSVLAPKVKPRPGWIWSSLSSLAKLESGHTPSRRHPEYWGGGIGWISIRDAKDHNGGIVMETREKTNDLGISRSSARVLPKDTICLSRTASVGYVVKMGSEMATSQDFVSWICGPKLDPDFLMLLLQAQGDDLKKFSSGAVHQTIYFPEVKAFHICHPRIDVQREIARSLQAFRQEAAKAEDVYVEKLADIAALRQSLLQAAFSGQLS
jgi:type I restriction enzyme S subunit